MKLRRGDETKIVYFDADMNEHERDEILGMVQGKTISEGKQIVRQYKKTTAWPWMDREGNVVAWSYSPLVLSLEIKPADAEQKQAEYLRRLREALEKVSRPDATPQDMAEALRLQLEYEKFKAMLED